MNIDLHTHSRVSDGGLSPSELVELAWQRGVDVLALTDHDELGGLAEAQAAAEERGLRFVPGVEISVTWANRGVHIVGLGVDPSHPVLLEGLRRTRQGRWARAEKIAAGLEQAGYPGAFAAAQSLANNPELISRTHFARFLVTQGAASTVSQVFERFLAPGKPGYVPMQWASLQEAVNWIRQAGGRAVIAHPGRYRYNATSFDAFFAEFRDLGGEGIEVVTGSHAPEQYEEYARVARRFGFLASRGSDFHAPGESRFEPGQMPNLPARLTPVWHDWW